MARQRRRRGLCAYHGQSATTAILRWCAKPTSAATTWWFNIFVNRLQFGQGEDLTTIRAPLQADAGKLQGDGVAVVFRAR